MRIAVLCDGRSLARWQREALARIAPDHELFLLVARDSRRPRRRLRHAAYYALNLAAIRNAQTRRLPFPEDWPWPIADRFEFSPGYDGNWATLSDDAVAWLADSRIDAVVKFALDLLRIPPPERLPVPILSYHHGDPSRYRGRPAGFHEMREGAGVIGQVVQVLGNRLDAGEVLVFADSRVIAHDYRATLVEAYRLSPFLLPEALEALAAGRRIDRPPSGRAYRLPSNMDVIRFVLRLAGKAARRLGYGLFVEKRWRVATAEAAPGLQLTEAVRQADVARAGWKVARLGPRHRFHADPFFLPDGSILVEAMNRRSGKGEILRIDGDRQTRLTDGRKHFSYPCHADGRVVPETAQWGPPAAYRIGDDALTDRLELDIDAPRLLDPTVFLHDGHCFLFGNEPADGAGVLHLWVAPALSGRFRRHPASPVRIAASGSRMAGSILRTPDGLFRFGQDWRRGYGDGLVVFRIVELGAEAYSEIELGPAAFASVRGPHTLNWQGGRLLFDFYEERVSPLAGVRRLLALL